MPYMYSEMQNKLSKTRDSPLESMGQIISSRCPDWPSGLEKKIFENGGHIHVYTPGQGQSAPWGQIVSLTDLFCQFSPLL